MTALSPVPAAAARTLWSWSLSVLEDEAARRALLQLQDGYGLNGSLALWAAWCGRAGVDLPEDDARKIIGSVSAMDRYVVRRLREVRRHAASPRPGFDADGLRTLRRDVYEAELAAERLIQDRLEADTLAACRRCAPDDGTARTLFAACVRALETPVLLADDRDEAGPSRLFETLLAQAPPLPGASGVRAPETSEVT